MELKTLEIGPFQVNCYVLIDKENKIFSLIDAPGQHPLFQQLVNSDFKLDKVLLTHGHVDHVAGLKKIIEEFKAKSAVHLKDLKMFKKAGEGQFASMLNAENPPDPSFLLEENQLIETAGVTLKVIHTPGHTQGGVCFYDRTNNNLFSGDTLFARSIGRTDLKGGNHQELIASIKNKLLTLPKNTKVFPGHSASTSILEELENNPFL